MLVINERKCSYVKECIKVVSKLKWEDYIWMCVIREFSMNMYGMNYDYVYLCTKLQRVGICFGNGLIIVDMYKKSFHMF